MSQEQKKSGSMVAIITMFFLFAMIAFVTNMAAPVGNIWTMDDAVGNNPALGFMGNFMNFLAYLFMGIPAGNMLTKVGYKKTALIAIVVGIVGLLIQYASGFSAGVTGFSIYLLGAFVCGLCVCMLNTVVNPMLNLIGGGGTKGNQLLQLGGACNSLAGTIAPIMVGAYVGSITKTTKITDVSPMLFGAIAIFVIAFIVIYLAKIDEPRQQKAEAAVKDPHSPWSFRHFILGTVAIFCYVGMEVGIPNTFGNFLSKAENFTAFDSANAANAAAIIGGMTGLYWLLMLVGRLASGFISGKVSSRAQLLTASCVGICLVLISMFVPEATGVSMVGFSNGTFAVNNVPLFTVFLVLMGLCTSIMWGCIFNLATEGLGKYTEKASGIFMMMVVGGGILPLIQNSIVSDTIGSLRVSYIIVVAVLAYMIFYALIGSKNVNKDIKVD
ncbi:MAG: sugar MFS transporter [Bacteroidaceae bacterium]|jgi:FHS family L-fucose permease-like MFS transporter|nr:sugar MFS transporter [Bacteroidaceae bacterium]MBP3833663.1 MFS transporter [Bacteroidaceae bacterium]MBQ8485283.1 MFS transporter [Bacteroidaceae bacterium]MBQ9675787.1 MFS transporter [Bacteroidaceae bacterium]